MNILLQSFAKEVHLWWFINYMIATFSGYADGGIDEKSAKWSIF